MLQNQAPDRQAQRMAAAAAVVHRHLLGPDSFKTSFDSTNPEATRAAATRSSLLIAEVGAETVAAAQAIIANMFAAGVPPRSAARQIREIIGLTEAQSISVVRLSEQLRKAKPGDLITRFPVIRDKAGKIIGTRKVPGFRVRVPPGGLSRARRLKLMKKYRTMQMNARALRIARTECLVGETVVDAAVVDAVTRRWFKGHVVEIATGHGRQITVTPNHPMLTSRGWVAAGALRKGDDLVCDGRDEHAQAPPADPHVHGVPTQISELYRAVSVVGVTQRERCADHHFHGDGMDGDVDVAYTDRALKIGSFAALYEPAVKAAFAPADLANAPLCLFCRRLLSVDEQQCLCLGSQLHAGLVQHAADDVRIYAERGGQLAQRRAAAILARYSYGINVIAAVVGVTTTPEEVPTSLGQGAALDAGSVQNPGSPAHVARHAPAYLGQAEAAGVELDHVVSINSRPFEGHVYCVSTPFGYFNAGGGFYVGNSIRAANMGQVQLWEQARKRGELRGDELRKWSAAMDSRTCATCQALDGQTVRFSDMFNSDLGPLDGPPAHVMCRCATGMVRGTAADRRSAVLNQPSSAYSRSAHSRRKGKDFFTADKYLTRGNASDKSNKGWEFTDERSRLHDAIEADMRAQWRAQLAREGIRPPPPYHTTVHTMGGGPASGKGGVKHSRGFSEGRMIIDVDEIRAMLPEYREWQFMDAQAIKDSAFRTHNESSWLADQIKANAQRDGIPMLVDSTLAGNSARVKGTVDGWRRAGADWVEARFVTADTDVAWARAVQRSKETGRSVPEEYFREAHRSISETLPKLTREGYFDRVELWDTNDGPTGLRVDPTLIMSGNRKGFTIHNQTLWERFLNKNVGVPGATGGG